jgi:hypothetical protein
VNESTQTEGGADSPPGYTYCSWHENYSRSAVLVQIIEQGSAFGASLYACAACREQYGLTPVAEQS